MRRQDDVTSINRSADAGRVMITRLPGLTSQQTCVFKAIGQLAMTHWDRRLSVGHVTVPLAGMGIGRRQVESALDPLGALGYVYADDAPGNPEIMLLLTTKGLETYCQSFVRDFRRIGPEILRLVCQDTQRDVAELARLSGKPDLLVEHVLDCAHAQGMIRLKKQGYYIVVTWVSPNLRRWLSGAA